MRGIATALLLLGAGVAQAALQPYPSQGANLVYSTGQDLTWTADANLFKTQCDAEGANNCPNLIAAIMDAGSLVTHTGTGTFPSPHAVLTTEFNQTNGQMTWFAAQAWVAYLNSISYGGATNWRLWSSGPAPGAGYNRSDSELGYLYYTEARLLRDTQITNSTQLKAVFNNLQNEFYWSGTEYATNPVNAWAFNANNGYQNGNSKAIKYYGWAVRPGQVAPQTHTIGGTVSGLDGSVVLQNNAGDDRTVSSNGPFTFATALDYGSSYTVTVLTQPTEQTCTVSNGTGTANADVTNIAVSCVYDPPPPPINVQATAGIKQIIVTFTTETLSSMSLKLSDSSVTYTANCSSSNDGVSGSITGPSSPLVVTGVTPGKSYTCTVSATGAGGTSTSSPSNVVNPLDDPTPIPTLSEWAKILLALSLIGMAGWYWKKRVS